MKLLSFLAVFVLLAGCNSPSQRSGAGDGRQSVPGNNSFEAAVEMPLNDFVDQQSISLFGSWNVADFYGHVDQRMGYNNCFGYRIGDVQPIRIEATATWDSGGPHEDQMQLFHFFKSDNSPAYGMQYSVGASPLTHQSD